MSTFKAFTVLLCLAAASLPGSFGVKLNLTATSECATAGLSEVFEIDLSGCQSANVCNLRNGSSYDITVQFKPSANTTNQTEARVTTTVGTTEWLFTSAALNREYALNTNYSTKLSFQIYPNLTASNYALTFDLRENQTTNIVCKNIPIRVITTVNAGNNAAEVGQNCTVVNEPCNFSHSFCKDNGSNNRTCTCLPDAVEVDSICKIPLNGACTVNEDCTSGSSCKASICTCDTELDAGVCKSGVDFLYSAPVVLFVIQLVAYALK